MTPTLEGFQEFRDEYVEWPLCEDPCEALRFVDGLVTAGRSIPSRSAAAPAHS